MHDRLHPKLFIFCEAKKTWRAQNPESLRSKGLTTAFSTSRAGESCLSGASVHNQRLQLSWSPYLSCSRKTWLPKRSKKHLTNVSSNRNGHFALHVEYLWIFCPKGLKWPEHPERVYVTPLKDRRRIAENQSMPKR